jgi:hypothetical protein
LADNGGLELLLANRVHVLKVNLFVDFDENLVIFERAIWNINFVDSDGDDFKQFAAAQALVCFDVFVENVAQPSKRSVLC